MISPYYEDQTVVIYHGDCRDLLPDLGLQPDATVADPPYGETSLAWDRWPLSWPGVIPGSVLWCFGSMRMFLEQRAEFDGWRFGQDVVWEKHNGSGFHADRFKRVHEHVVHWYRGAWEDQRRATPTVDEATKRQVRRKERPTHMGAIADSTYTSEDGGPKLMRSVIFRRSCHGHAVHPTQKPVGIVVPLIDYSCPPGGLILDPFMGSGTTLLAARLGGHRAVGIEVDEKWCEVAAARLAGQGTLVLAEGGDHPVTEEEQ